MPDPLFVFLLAIVAAVVIILSGLVPLRQALARRALEREGDAVTPGTLLRALKGRRPILLAVDTSGSMYTFRDVREAWMQAFREAGARVVTFDHELHLEPSDYIGGGTNFEAVRTYVESLPTHPVVVMLTDGVGVRFEPAKPDLWHWALVDDGFLQLATKHLQGMSTYTVHQEV